MPSLSNKSELSFKFVAKFYNLKANTIKQEQEELLTEVHKIRFFELV